MARIILITGGSRSGKSHYAQTLAEAMKGKRVYVATCPVVDDELRSRIRKHRDVRAGRGWETIEEQVNLAGAIRRATTCDVVLVDCLTLWVNNLMYASEQRHEEIDEANMEREALAVIAACREHAGTVILVTNEVGMGVVPENALARHFRDLAGRCNQIFAREADTVTLVCCGIPMCLKGTN